jgi:hypothetical protein
MGWSAWEVFRATTPRQNPDHSLSETLIKQTADALVEGGFSDAGYKIVWIDDAWASKERSKIDGSLIPDPTRWPNGMKAVADYVHSKGLLLGLVGTAVNMQKQPLVLMVVVVLLLILAVLVLLLLLLLLLLVVVVVVVVVAAEFLTNTFLFHFTWELFNSMATLARALARDTR